MLVPLRHPACVDYESVDPVDRRRTTRWRGL